MADACSDIYAALARLEAKIDGIPKVDEQSIIQKAVKAVFANPEWLGLFGALGIVKGGMDEVKRNLNTFYKANDSIMGELAEARGLIKDNNKKINGFQKALDFMTTDVADLFGKYGKLANSVASIVGAVGSIAGLASLAGTMAVVFPRLDALDAAADQARNAAAEAMRIATGALFTARDAKASATRANEKADHANNTASVARSDAANARIKALDAVQKANEAISKSNKATETANGAIQKANTAIDKAEQADGKSNTALEKATGAEQEAVRAHKRLDGFDAGVRALHADLVNRIGIVFKGLLQAINDSSAELHAYVDILIVQIRSLERKLAATEQSLATALGRSDQALNTAKGASSKADQALQEARNGTTKIVATNAQIAQVKPLSETLLLNTFKQYNIAPQTIGDFNNRQALTATSVKEAHQDSLNKIKAAHDNALSKIDAVAKENERKIKEVGLAKPAPLTLTPEQIAKGFDASPAVKQLQKDIAEAKATQAPDVTPAVRDLQKDVSQIKNQQANEKKVNEQAITKLDTIIKNQDKPTEIKLPPQTEEKIDAIKQAQGNIVNIVGNIKDVLKGITDQINKFVTQQNNFQLQFSAAIKQINGFFEKVNTYLFNINKTLLDFSFKLTAILAFTVIAGPQIALILARVGTILLRLGKLIKWLALDRIINLINFVANLHNALMLSNQLKITLLEMLSSLGNATGLLQTADGDNVDLNSVFAQGVEGLMVFIMGEENYAGLKVAWRKYNRIYQAATNSVNAISNMFNSIGNAIETIGEHTGKIGNSLRGAGVVAENAYQWFSERVNARMSKFIKYETTVGNTIQFLEVINEISENVVEGQQAYTEAVKATTEFNKQQAEAQKNPGIENKVIAEERKKIKENSIKDPTGESETGLLSFLTD